MQKVLIDTYMLILPLVLGYIIWILKESNKKRDANSRGTMILLQIQLIEYHDKYCSLGFIPSYAYRNFCNAYNAYSDLGGNDMITKMKKEVEVLEIRKGGIYKNV